MYFNFWLKKANIIQIYFALLMINIWRSLKNWGAWAPIIEAHDQSFTKRNTKSLLTEKKQVEKNIESKIG